MLVEPFLTRLPRHSATSHGQCFHGQLTRSLTGFARPAERVPERVAVVRLMFRCFMFIR